MRIRSMIICAAVFILLILLGAIANDSLVRSRPESDGLRIYSNADRPDGSQQPFKPREYVRIGRTTGTVTR